MRHSLLTAALLTALVAGCKAEAPTAPATSSATATAAASQADARFAELSKRWLEGWLPLNPVAATQIGDHRFDAELDDVSAAGRQRALDFSKKLLAELDAIDAKTLSRENQVDAAILRNQLRGDIWSTETLQAWAWDPQGYSGLAGSAIYNLMAREFAPLPERLKSATARMEKLPALFAQMRAEIVPARVPRIHAETVAKQHAGLLSLVDTFITPNADKLQGEDRARLDAAVAGLRKAVAEHQEWLDKTLVPNAKGDFRIGQKLYDEKLQFSLNVGCRAPRSSSARMRRSSRVRGEMYAVARRC
jgi:uncharacterized protein (DUF885 family)